MNIPSYGDITRFDMCQREFGRAKQLEDAIQSMSEFAFKQGQHYHQLNELSQRASDLNLTINYSNEMYEIRRTHNLVTLMCLKTLDEVSIFIHGYAQGANTVND